MHLDIELCLQSRQPDRVVVRLKLVPQADEGVQVDGAAVDLLSREGDALCPRVLLPFAGLLRAPITTTVELRGRTFTGVFYDAAGTELFRRSYTK